MKLTTLFSLLMALAVATPASAGPALESPPGERAYSERIGPDALAIAVFDEFKAKFGSAEVDLEITVPVIRNGAALWDDESLARQLESMTAGGTRQRGMTLSPQEFVTDGALDSSAFGRHVGTRLADLLNEASPPSPDAYPDGTVVEAGAEACPVGALRVSVKRLSTVPGLAPGWYVTERTWSPLACSGAAD